jgi:hypothetical protein
MCNWFARHSWSIVTCVIMIVLAVSLLNIAKTQSLKKQGCVELKRGVWECPVKK